MAKKTNNLNGIDTSTMAPNVAALVETLAATQEGRSVQWTNEDVDIDRHGKKIVLPNEPGPMPLLAAKEALERKIEEENVFNDVHEVIKAYPLEGAVAFMAAMKEIYGWASPVPTMTFFGPKPPKMMTVEIDFDEYIQVPWGQFKVPGIENNIGLSTSRDPEDGQEVMVIYGEVRKPEKEVLLEIAQRTREILRSSSIYRGKAIHLSVDDEGKLAMERPPKFMDLRNVREDELILNADVAAQINTNVFAPIEHTELVKTAGIPLKRGVLLEGTYGVGKTMTTRITGSKCVNNGWTFITVDKPDSLEQALLFAQRYQPSVVFCEDIDRGTSTRDDKANGILNTIDGILSKSTEVMTVLTTNHVNKIEQAMLRPGRLDAVISVTPPNAESVGRLIRLYSRGLLREQESLTSVGEELAGNIPATVREVVERSKLSMIANGNVQLTEEDLLISARGMKSHLTLLEKKDEQPNTNEAFGIAVGNVMREAFIGPVDSDRATKVDVAKLNNNLKQAVAAIMSEVEDAAGASRKVVQKLDEVEETVEDTAEDVKIVKRKVG